MIKLLLSIIFIIASANAEEIVRNEYKPTNTLTPEFTKKFVSYATLNNTTNIPTNEVICGKLYKFSYDKNGNQVGTAKEIEATNTLIDFNADNGVFTCLYTNPTEFGKDNVLKLTNSLPDYKKYISIEKDNAFSLMNGKFTPNNLSKLSTVKDNTDFSVFQTASEMNMMVLSKSTVAKTEERPFTVSQFISSLLTLNSDVIMGTSANGDIKITPEVEQKMSILHFDGATWTQKAGDLLSKAGDSVKKFFGMDVTQKKASDVSLKNRNGSVNSFTDYFDKKIFGLYYTFMAVSWGSIFSYASLLILGFTTLYTSLIVGSKFLMHKIDDEQKDRPFEFPLRTRLVAMGTTMVLSFVQYPAGSGITIPQKDGMEAQIQAQTSIAKNLIAYMANTGAVIADLSASASIVTYLDYLVKSTNSQSKKQIEKMDDELKGIIATYNVKSSFYKDECVASMDERFAKLNSFQSATVHEDSKWVVSDQWRNNPNSKFLGVEKISPLYCKNLEKDIFLGKKLLNMLKSSSEANINNITDSSSPQTLMTRLYVLTQLNATKSLGWINIATLPISHVFMLNSGVLGLTGSDSRTSTGMSSKTNVSVMIGDEVTNQYDRTKSEAEAKKAKDLYSNTGDPDNSKIEQMITSLLSYQVYMMLPAFEDTRKSMEAVISGGTDILFNIIPALKEVRVITKIYDFFTKKSDSGDVVKTGLGSLIVYILSFMLAVMIYKILLTSIFAGVITLLTVLKIVLYFIEVFVHFFVSPLIVVWQLTINPQTDRVHRYITSGFIIYIIKPTLIVFSCVMFIFAYEVMQSLYSLIFDLVYSSLEFSNEMFDAQQSGTGIGAMITMGAVKGFGEIFIMIFGMILAYFMILKGDDLILQKFGYKDDSDNGMAHQLGDKLQNLAGGRI